MAEHDDLDDILDSALDDFHIADTGRSSNLSAAEDSSRISRENMPLGQGLGIGLPALGAKGKKAGSAKAKCSGKTSSSSKTDDKSPINDGHLTDTVEELAQQTRQTLEGMDANDQEGMADKLVESIVKQFEELGSSQSSIRTTWKRLT